MLNMCMQYALMTYAHMIYSEIALVSYFAIVCSLMSCAENSEMKLLFFQNTVCCLLIFRRS